ncbi:hypothetical protein MNEG_14109, partial [Monoraphidium neglectum]
MRPRLACRSAQGISVLTHAARRTRPLPLQVRAAGQAGGSGDKPGADVQGLDAIMSKYGLSDGSPSPAGSSSGKPARRPTPAPRAQQP